MARGIGKKIATKLGAGREPVTHAVMRTRPGYFLPCRLVSIINNIFVIFFIVM